MKTTEPQLRCGIVLAGGEGLRLRPYIHRLRGDRLPKQYVNFTDEHSLLDHTLHRCERLIPPERIFTVASQAHMDYDEVQWQLSHRPKGTVILQPENKETGPGILLPLLHIYKRFPESIVTVFPSDHFIKEEALFMGYVDLAFRAVSKHPDLLVLLGLEPQGPEADYGYILPGERIDAPADFGLHRVRHFVEKPNTRDAAELIRCGGLWNSFVMTFQTKTILRLIREIMPELFTRFKRILAALGTADEEEEVSAVYTEMKPENFSTAFLQRLPVYAPKNLAVLPVLNVFWSDFGSEQRILSAVQHG